jgi:acyl-CoA synthetase (AMP-forming)/AMP-acid ligase II
MGAISELSGNQSSADPQTITQRLNYVVEQHPDSIAIVCTHQLPDLYGFCSCAANETKAPYLRWTYATLHQAVCRLANGLKNQGLAPGTPMLVVCENQIEQVVAALAAFAADFIHVPVNPASLAHAEEVQHMVNTVMEFHETERMAIIAKDENTARRIDEKLNIPPNAVKICWQASEINEWICLQSFFDNPGDPVQPLQPEQAVFFTSGSTALPKGCLIRAARWFDVLIPSLSLGSTCPGNSVAVPVLMNHAFGFICTILPLLCGATVVFASHRFKPQETAEALQRENCTHAAMVPTMVRSLAEILDQPTKLQQVTFAGMAMTPQVLRRCQQSLGKCKVENFYGMTEGVFVSTGPVADPDVIVKGYDVAIGRPVQACQIRVCAEGEQTPLSRGTAGHLHFSGPSVVNGYLGSNTHDFYEADGQVWFKTGDQVILDDDQLYYVGRYKDMIVRGGENISLSKIEAILAQLPQSHALQPQVVAAPDPIAGEAPLAVVTTDIEDQELVKQMKERVRSSLGVKYVPSSFVSLRKLGLDDYPRTAVGKVQKMKLTEIVRHFCQQSQSEDIEQPPDSLEQLIQAVWGRVLGMQTDSIDVNAPLSLFADSITLLTARDRIQKATARSVPLAQWLDATTIAEQITLLQNGSNFKEALAAPTQPQHGPLKVGDMVHLGGDDDAFIKTRTAVEKILEPHGLTWGEVRHVTPCTDFVQAIARSRVVNTWNIRTSVLSKGASIEVCLL